MKPTATSACCEELQAARMCSVMYAQPGFVEAMTLNNAMAASNLAMACMPAPTSAPEPCALEVQALESCAMEVALNGTSPSMCCSQGYSAGMCAQRYNTTVEMMLVTYNAMYASAKRCVCADFHGVNDVLDQPADSSLRGRQLCARPQGLG
jgi:hypothetical protein